MSDFDLDLDFNNEQSEVLQKSRPTVVDVYQQAINYGTKKGLSERQIHEVMSSVTGDACEQAYEEALAKYRTDDNLFPDEAAQARQACLDKMAKKEKRIDFWNKLLTGINTVADKTNKHEASNNGQNMGSNVNTPNYPPPSPTPDTDVRILGMKPLVFTVVALGVVVMGGIAIAMLGKKAGAKAK